jgi:predicted esterase
MLLLHPGLLRAAALFRAMVPFEPEVTPDLSRLPVFMAAGRQDRMIPPDNTQRLADILAEAGAEVDLRWRNVGHPLTYEEVAEAKEWLSQTMPTLSATRDNG